VSATDLSYSQMAEARRLYSEGATLGEIAKILDCSIYDLSPWLYMEHIHRDESSKP
jgi:hypothetical protein